MSSFNRRLFLLGTAALAGCGFTPVYGPNGGGRKFHGQIRVDEPKTSNEFALVRQLEHRIGTTNAPRYAMSYALTTSTDGVALTSNDITTRIELIGEVTYALRDLTTKEVVQTGKVNSFTGYSTTGNTVATIAAERDANERLMIILADKITTELIAHSDDLPV